MGCRIPIYFPLCDDRRAQSVLARKELPLYLSFNTASGEIFFLRLLNPHGLDARHNLPHAAEYTIKSGANIRKVWLCLQGTTEFDDAKSLGSCRPSMDLQSYRELPPHGRVLPECMSVSVRKFPAGKRTANQQCSSPAGKPHS